MKDIGELRRKRCERGGKTPAWEMLLFINTSWQSMPFKTDAFRVVVVHDFNGITNSLERLELLGSGGIDVEEVSVLGSLDNRRIARGKMKQRKRKQQLAS